MQTLPVKQQVLCRHADIRLCIPVLTWRTCSIVCHEGQELLLQLQLTHLLPYTAVITQDVDCLLAMKGNRLAATTLEMLSRTAQSQKQKNSTMSGSSMQSAVTSAFVQTRSFKLAGTSGTPKSNCGRTRMLTRRLPGIAARGLGDCSRLRTCCGT